MKTKKKWFFRFVVKLKSMKSTVFFLVNLGRRENIFFWEFMGEIEGEKNEKNLIFFLLSIYGERYSIISRFAFKI